MTNEIEPEEVTGSPDVPPKLAGVNESDGPQTFTEPKPARAKAKRRRPDADTQTLEQRCCMLGHAVGKLAKFCPQCGVEIRDYNWKPQCGNGHEVAAADHYCAQCGLPVSASTPPVVSPSGAVTVEAPRPESELSEAEIAERARRHAEAVRLGKENKVAAYAPGKAPAQVQTTIVHFLVDGITAFGNTWFRGQEIEVWPGHPRWDEAQQWITLDVAGQYTRYGRQIFGLGPWPGVKSYTAGAGMFQPLVGLGEGEGPIPQPTKEELERADEMERRRGRRVPMPIA